MGRWLVSLCWLLLIDEGCRCLDSMNECYDDTAVFFLRVPLISIHWDTSSTIEKASRSSKGLDIFQEGGLDTGNLCRIQVVLMVVWTNHAFGLSGAVLFAPKGT